MARYRVRLYGKREVEADVIVEAADEDAAAIRAEYLAVCDQVGNDIHWKECEGCEEITEIMGDAADEVEPNTPLTHVRSTRPGNSNWYASLSPASSTLVARRR